MKTKKTTKLAITKTTISNLSNNTMNEIRGGVLTDECPSFNPFSCKPICEPTVLECPPDISLHSAC